MIFIDYSRNMVIENLPNSHSS